MMFDFALHAAAHSLAAVIDHIFVVFGVVLIDVLHLLVHGLSRLRSRCFGLHPLDHDVLQCPFRTYQQLNPIMTQLRTTPLHILLSVHLLIEYLEVIV